MDIKEMDTGKRIEFLLELKEVSKSQLAKHLGVVPSTITGYIKGNRNINLKILTSIADFLNVSADFLLCRSDDYSAQIERDVNGNTVLIKLKDKKCRLTEEQIQLLFTSLEKTGWDIDKALKDNFQK